MQREWRPSAKVAVNWALDKVLPIIGTVILIALVLQLLGG